MGILGLVEANAENSVPSLLRFLVIVGLVAGLIFAAMVALVTFVQPEQREMTHSINPARLNK